MKVLQNSRKVIVVIYILLSIVGYLPLKGQSVIQAPDPSGSTDSIFDNHVSSLISVGEDSLLAVWFGGYVEGDKDNVIYSKRSFDAGQSWVDRDTLFYGVGDTLFRDPHLFNWKDTLYMLFNRQVGEGSVKSAAEYKLLLSYSLDKGQTWTTPSILEPGGTGVNLDLRIVAPFNEHIVLNNHPVFGVHWRETGVSQPHVSLLHLDLQSDTTFLTGDLTAPYNIVEPALLKNGNMLYLYLRNTEGFIQYSTSNDNGVIWTGPVSTKLVCSYSLFSIKQIASDSILVVWNNHRNQRDYLTAGLCKSFDLSDIYWAKELDYQKSFRGQVSYPATLIFSKDTFGVSYTDRLYLGRDVNNKPILRGTIRYETVSFNQINDLAPYTSPLDSLHSPTLLNEITQITNNRYIVLGDDAWATIHDQQFGVIDTLNLSATPYDLNHAIVDSAHGLIHILCDGGYYVRYNCLNKTVTHQKRFQNLGAFNLNHGLLRDSCLYVVTFNGDLGQISHPDSNGSILIAGNGLANNRILGDSIFYLLGDSLRLSTFNRASQQLSIQNTSLTTHAGFSDALLMDSVLIAVGGRGFVSKYFLNGSGLSLTQLYNGAYNFNSVLSLNDSLVFIGSDSDIGLVYNLADGSTHKIKFLPKKQHGQGTLSQGQKFLWYTIEGGVYELSKQQLVSETLGIPVEKMNCISFFQAFPQPVSYLLMIESSLEIHSIELRTLNGQMLEEIQIGGVFNYQLSMYHLRKGSYVLTVNSKGGRRASALLLKQ